MTNLINSIELLHKNSTNKAEHLSDQYAPINTKLLLTPFFNNGWTVGKKRVFLNSKGIGTEQYILHHDDYMYTNGDRITIDCLNSNDGSKALMLYGGYGRIACSNGLVVGELEGGRFIHRGTKIYTKINDQYTKIVAYLDELKTKVDRLKEVELNDTALDNAIDNIVSDLFNKDTKKQRVTAKITPWSRKRIKRIRRLEDKNKDGFTLLNVIQENIIRRGLLDVEVYTYNKETKESTTQVKSKRRCENKLSAVRINKTISQAFLNEVA